jgi:hypothetical protein
MLLGYSGPMMGQKRRRRAGPTGRQVGSDRGERLTGF